MTLSYEELIEKLAPRAAVGVSRLLLSGYQAGIWDAVTDADADEFYRMDVGTPWEEFCIHSELAEGRLAIPMPYRILPLYTVPEWMLPELIGRAIAENRTINALGFHNLDAEDVLTMLSSLPTHPSVKAVYLKAVKLTNEALQRLLGLLQGETCHVRALILDGELGQGAAECIASGLGANIEMLVLNRNGFGDEGAQVMAQMLKGKGCKLYMLGLGGNEIGDAGVTALAGALPYNRRLKKLDLCVNTFTDAGITALMKELKQCPQLEFLGLEGNTVEDTAAVAECVQDAFAGHPSINFFLPPRSADDEPLFTKAQNRSINQILGINGGKYYFARGLREQLRTLLLLHSIPGNRLAVLPMEMLFEITDHLFATLPGKTFFFFNPPHHLRGIAPQSEREIESEVEKPARLMTEEEQEAAAVEYGKRIGY